MRRETSRLSFLMCPFCVRALVPSPTTNSVRSSACGDVAGIDDQKNVGRDVLQRMAQVAGSRPVIAALLPRAVARLGLCDRDAELQEQAAVVGKRLPPCDDLMLQRLAP
jgi:hypothetical protein